MLQVIYKRQVPVHFSRFYCSTIGWAYLTFVMILEEKHFITDIYSIYPCNINGLNERHYFSRNLLKIVLVVTFVWKSCIIFITKFEMKIQKG